MSKTENYVFRLAKTVINKANKHIAGEKYHEVHHQSK